MITKDDLKLYRHLKKEARELAEQIEELEMIMIVPGCQQITGMPLHHNGERDKIANVIAKLEQLRKAYFEKMDVLLDLQAEIEAAVDKLESKERRLIRLYYFVGLTWEEVAVQMEYSRRQVHNLHSRVLNCMVKSTT